MKKTGASRMFLTLAAAALVGCGGDGGGPTITCDLAVMSVDVPDGAYDLTHSLDVSISTYNYGPDDCPSYTVALYLSHDIFVRALEDRLIGSESRTGGLASGATDGYTGTVSWSGVPQGSYYVGMIITYAGDANALNNAGYDPTAIMITPGGVAADLYDEGDASNGFTPTTVIPGETWSAWCDVRNGGDGDAGPFYVDFYASADETITTSDHLLGSVPVSSGVGVGSLVDADLNLISFPWIPGGTYYVGWIIDAGGVVLESDESNNTAYEASDTLTVDFVDPDPFEPNNAAATAYNLGAEPYTTLYGYIIPSGDEDWFRFDIVSMPDYYYIVLYLYPPAGEDYDLYVYEGPAGSPTLLDSSTSGGVGETESIGRYSGHPLGDYYILVKGKTSADWSDTSYTLVVNIW